ncbi:MAG: gliding motility-associated C-terminal domain-containing protein [Bacteroidales bacterium]|nr:gliding motility-associated C-terminal domain-containing protein [Bacteroidales bacterium]
MEVKNWILILIFAGLLILPVKQVLAEKIDARPPCHTISLTGTHATCKGDTDGSLSLTISPSAGAYTITWSTGDINVDNLNNLPAGYYDVRVIDNNTGCVAFDIFSITEPDVLESHVTHNNINCFGQSTGNIFLDVTGGTEPYTYTWSNGLSTEDNTNIVAGTYNVTIVDDHGCETSNGATLTEPAMALGSDYVATDILCFGDSNSAIDVSVWGGTPPYIYNWNSNAFNSQDLTNIPAGTYNLIIKDILNCQTTHTVVIENPDVLEMAGTDIDNMCFGEENGSITLSVQGGIQPYSFTWANSSLMLSYDIPEITNLDSDQYFVTVADANGCSLTDDFEITSPTELVTLISGSNVNFLGGSDGQIDLTVSGGVPPYSYDWSNGVTTEDNNNVPAGEYTVTVTDINSCFVEESIIINEPLEALTFSYVATDASCHGSTDAKIYAYASGGTPPYLYSWSTGSDLSYILNIAAGTYSLTLTDGNNVEYSSDILVTQPESFSFTHSAVQPSCNGFNDGSIDLTLEGGLEPYRYHWYDPEFALAGLTQDINNVGKGNYTVEVIDTMGCRSEYSVIINEPEAIELSITESNIQCAGGTSGSIHSQVAGGTEPYSYIWSNDATTADLLDLSVGQYSLTVSDANSCLAYIQAVITEPEPIYIKLTSYKTSCIDQSDGYITSYIEGGSGGYDLTWSNTETTDDIYDLTGGEYTLDVIDVYGCSANASTTVEISEVACLTIPTSFSPNGDGINDDWVINNLYLYPDCNMQIFNKWGSVVFESPGYASNWDGTYNGNPLPAGTYYYILSFTTSLETLTGTITILK